ncbi:MAG: MATE family efflux transporter [Firmicutes bacterium]|nr:MATE family efflux transporter [Bacillota bacterium]
MDRIKLSDHFTYRRLARFVLPSIAMMVFTSIYVIVDGLFLSNFVGTTAFAAVNLVFPFMMLMSAIGFMIGTGGSALVAMQLGEGRSELAKQTFSMLIGLLFVFALSVSILAAIFMPQIAYMLGAKDGQFQADAVLYSRVTMISMPMFMLQNAFQSFFVTAEKPKLGLKITVAAGVTNMVLDLFFVGIFKWGIVGAALATVTAEYVGGLVPVVYFARKNDSLLALVPARLNLKYLGKTCYNGMSELLQNIAGSVVSIAYNLQLLRLVGENGVAAYGVLMYVNFIFSAVFFGYMIGSAPLFSFHYAAGTYDELQNLYRKTMKICAIVGSTMTVISWTMAPVLSAIFVSYDQELLDLTVHAMRITSVLFVMMGFTVFGSGFFTALGNGAVSAILAFARTVVLQLSAVFILPIFMGVDGIWASGPVSTILTALLTLGFLIKYKDRYHY